MLRNHFGSEWTLQWCKKLIENYFAGNQAEISAQYNGMVPQVRQVQLREPGLSMEHPPPAMFSLDMRIGLIPWVSSGFDRGLLLLFSSGTAFEKHFGDILPLAFVLSGGPETRAFLRKLEDGIHATLAPDATGRTFPAIRDTAFRDPSVHLPP